MFSITQINCLVKKSFSKTKKWVRRLDSNQRLQAYEACYLTTDLLRIFGANGGTRTLTAVNRRILSSLCLPVPPHSHIGALSRTRTCTQFQTATFEVAAYANFAIRAYYGTLGEVRTLTTFVT